MAETTTKKPRAKKAPVTTPAATVATTSVSLPPASDLAAIVQALQGQVNALLVQNQQLTQALVSAKEAAEAPKLVGDKNLLGSEVFRVVNVSGTTLHFSVVDPGTGRNRDVALATNGSYVNLSRQQLEELINRCPSLVDNKYVAIPGYLGDDPNVILSPERFIEDTPLDEVDARVDRITNTAALHALLAHINGKRFRHADAKGNPITTQNDRGETVPALEVLALPPKYMTAERAVARRIHALTGVVHKIEL